MKRIRFLPIGRQLALPTCLLLACVLTAAAHGVTLTPKNVSNSGSATQPVIAVDPTGKIINVVWRDSISGNAEIFFSRSTDGGLTFSPPKNLSNSAGVSTSPQLAVDSSGNINVAWVENLGGGLTELDYSRSSDGGATFATPKKLSWESAAEPRMALDSTGKIYLIWIDTDDCGSLLFARSADSGANFITSSLASTCTGGLGKAQLVIDSQDHINIVLVITHYGDGRIVFTRSVDEGATFSHTTTVADGGVTDLRMAVAANGTIAIIWGDNGTSADAGTWPGVYVAASKDGGATFGSVWTLNYADYGANPCGDIAADASGVFGAVSGGTGYISFHRGPDFAGFTEVAPSGWAGCGLLSVDSTGTFNVVWDDRAPGNEQVYYSRSTDGGVSFSTPDDLSNSLYDDHSPKVAIDGGGTNYVTWTSHTADSKTDVFFAFFPDTVSTDFELTVADGCANGGCGDFAATGHVVSTPPGLDCTVFPCKATFARGTEVTLEATPGNGAVFTGWSGACSGTGACVVTMNASRMVAARFKQPTVTVSNTYPSAGKVTSSPAGIDCGTTCTSPFTPGTTVTLTATPQDGFLFTGWGGACSGTGDCVLTADNDKTVSAYFIHTPITIHITITGGGSVYEADEGGLLCHGPGTCDFTASLDSLGLGFYAGAFPGWVFTVWGGDCAGVSDPGGCWVNGESDHTITVQFSAIPKHTVAIGFAGSGSGTVTSTPTGISCETPCSASFYDGTVVTLTAVAAQGSTFAGWSGDCSGTGVCQVTMSAARNVTATFNLVPTFALTVTRAGSGAGSVTSSPTGINCGSTCAANFNSATLVTLTATPAPGSTFGGWSGDCSGTGLCQVTMNAAYWVTAAFDLTPGPPDFSFDSPPAPQTVAPGQPAHFTITIGGSNGFSGTVSFACTSGMPALSSCLFSPPTVSGGGSTTLTINTSAGNIAGLRTPGGLGTLALAMPVFGLVFCGAAGVCSTRRRMAGVILVLPLVIPLAALLGCGGGAGGTVISHGHAGTPPGNYNVTVTATAGNVSHSQVVNLLVQ